MATKLFRVTPLADREMPNTGGWQDRHDAAIKLPAMTAQRKSFETAIVEMLKGWAKYAEDHQVTYEAPIGNDCYLREPWKAIGDSLRSLLNGQTGRLDCETLDGYILNMMRHHGIDTDNK